MDYALREHLATEFAGVIKSTREEKWDAFCKAAEQTSLDPYIALARMPVRITEEAMDARESP